MKGHQKKVQSDIKMLLRKDCEVEKIMRFLKTIERFEKL